MKPRRFNPIVSLMMAIVFIGFGASSAYFAYQGLKTGLIRKPSKYSPMRIVSKDDASFAFSYSMFFYSGASLLFTCMGLFQIREARLWFVDRKLIKVDQNKSV